MQYKVILTDSVGSLERRVNDAIKQGWIPQGGIAVWSERTSPIMQAMIRPEEPKR